MSQQNGAGAADDERPSEGAVLRGPGHPPPLPTSCPRPHFLFQRNKQFETERISSNVFSSPLRSW